jgi:hypothetical protein
VAVLGAALAVALAGCSTAGSVTAGSPTVGTGAMDTAAVTIGAQAVGATPSATPSPSSTTTGWSSAVTCPDSFRQGVLASAPAGTTLTALDASTTTGVSIDQELFNGDTPNCAYALAESGHQVDAVVFIGMPESYQAPIVAKLEADGFVGATPIAETGGTAQIFSDADSRIAVERLSEDGISFFMLIG